jgi:hypothetical protein
MDLQCIYDHLWPHSWGKWWYKFNSTGRPAPSAGLHGISGLGLSDMLPDLQGVRFVTPLPGKNSMPE